MKIYCAECGKEIKNPHYLNGKLYGYNCYKKELAILYKQWEDERNTEYSAKCFSAMEVFKTKKSNSFHDSIVNQWNNCKKLTAKQLECIIRGFTLEETISFYKLWFLIANKENQKGISSWLENIILKNKIVFKIVHDEEICNILLVNHPSGIHFIKDIDDSEEDIFFRDNGKYTRKKNENGKKIYNTCFLEEDKQNIYYQILNIIEETV